MIHVQKPPLRVESISTTFKEQLLHQFSCAKKVESQTSSTKKATHEPFVQKSCA
jgi:hypothetical protein